MDHEIDRLFPFVFPIFFVSLWLAITTFLGFTSGWYRLARLYRDRPEVPLLQLRRQSGSMGVATNMRGILSLGVCRSGLRVGIMRIFGPFSRPFFIPWKEIRVSRTTSWFWPVAKLRFGDPQIGTLSILAATAARLAEASGGQWPEAILPPREPGTRILLRVVAGWLLMTAFASAFFIIASHSAGDQHPPPIMVLILFPAIVFGANAAVMYYRATR